MSIEPELVPAGDPPPRVHDPRRRALARWLDRWQVRRASSRPRPLHLQLWLAGRGISILTPSRRTAGRFELWARGQPARRLADVSAVNQTLASLRAPTIDPKRLELALASLTRPLH